MLSNDVNNLQSKQNSMEEITQYVEDYKRYPIWMIKTSKWVAGIMALLFFVFMLLEAFHINKSLQGQPITQFVILIFLPSASAFVAALLSGGMTLLCLDAFCSGANTVKKGTIKLVQKTSDKSNVIAKNVVKKITTVVEEGKAEARLEQEKKILQGRVNDLEIQRLKNRIEELEKEIHNK